MSLIYILYFGSENTPVRFTHGFRRSVLYTHMTTALRSVEEVAKHPDPQPDYLSSNPNSVTP